MKTITTLTFPDELYAPKRRSVNRHQYVLQRNLRTTAKNSNISPFNGIEVIATEILSILWKGRWQTVTSCWTMMPLSLPNTVPIFFFTPSMFLCIPYALRYFCWEYVAPWGVSFKNSTLQYLRDYIGLQWLLAGGFYYWKLCYYKLSEHARYDISRVPSCSLLLSSQIQSVMSLDTIMWQCSWLMGESWRSRLYGLQRPFISETMIIPLRWVILRFGHATNWYPSTIS